jgi:phosphatidylserine decarboxylase
LITNSKNLLGCNIKDKLNKNFTKTTVDSEGKQVITGIETRRGENFGEFNLGSTIVLIFEAPNDFTFNVTQNEKVLYGRKLGSSSSSSKTQSTSF